MKKVSVNKNGDIDSLLLQDNKDKVNVTLVNNRGVCSIQVEYTRSVSANYNTKRFGLTLESKLDALEVLDDKIKELTDYTVGKVDTIIEELKSREI